MPVSHLELKNFLHYDTFVECGSASGDGIQAAIDTGFKEVHSIEINPSNYENCVKRFLNNNRVHLYYGDCGVLLETVLNSVNRPCVVFADANGWVGEKESPFHSTIAAIIRSGRKDHTILVDDMNHDHHPRERVIKDLRWSRSYGSDQDMIKQVLLVNKEYNMYVMDTHSYDLNYTYESWVLVADPNKTREDVEFI